MPDLPFTFQFISGVASSGSQAASTPPYPFSYPPQYRGLTFLQLVQRAVRECGAAGTSIASVVDQTGENLRFVDWINEAWLEIQGKHDDWPWMRSSSLMGEGVSFVTVNGQPFYMLGVSTGATTFSEAAYFGRWCRYSFRCHTTSTNGRDEIFLDEIDYDSWRNAYMYGAQRDVRTRPVVMAIGPSQEICLGPVPTGNYTVTGDYFRAPAAMAENGDRPIGLPIPFQMMIVYLAMTFYGMYEPAPEVVQRGQAGYQKLLRQLEALRMPEITAGSALA